MGKEVCSKEFSHGSSVTLTAAAVEGYRFTGWSGDCLETPATCTLTMDGAKSVTANFVKKKYKLTVGKSTKGHVTWGTHINCGSGAGGTKCVVNEVEHGASVSLAATPNAGYGFESWSGCPTTGANAATTTPCAFTMGKAEEVTPTFASTLTVDAGGPYPAKYFPENPTPVIVVPAFYTVTVTAVAAGGKPAYNYRWRHGTKTTSWSTSGSKPYGFRASEVESGGSTTVTATARDANNETASKDATINFGSASEAGGASGQASDALPVPLGGELILVWGGEDSLSAVSGDPSIATVAVDGTVIVVGGASAGGARIVVRVGSEEFQVPVQVGG